MKETGPFNTQILL